MPAPRQLLPFNAWMPDQPGHVAPGSVLIQQLWPQDSGYYEPARSLVTQGDGLTTVAPNVDQITGAFYWPETNEIFVGTTDATDGAKLCVKTSPASATWYDVSQASYGTGFRRWKFTDYRDRVIAVMGAGNGAPQTWTTADDPTTDDFVDLGGSPPQADALITVRDWIILLRTNDPSDGTVNQRIWWSANGDPQDWPTPGTADARQKQSGYTDLLGGGALLEGRTHVAGHDAVVWGETRMWSINQQPPPTTWRFDPIADIGLNHPAALVSHANSAWWLSDDGFIEYSGGGVKPIGKGSVDRYFFADWDLTKRRIFVAVDSIRSRVIWLYTSNDASGTEYDKQIVYNWATGKWGQSEFDCEGIMRAPTDDALQRNSVFFFSSDWKIAKANGDSIQAEIESQEVTLDDYSMQWLERVRPVVLNSPGLDIQVKLRNTPEDQNEVETTFKNVENDRMLPIRVATRHWRARIRMPSTSFYPEAIGVQYEGRKFGEMRGGPRPQLSRTIDSGASRTATDSTTRTYLP